MKSKIIFSCEHASNAIPNEYVDLFSSYSKQLQSHLAYDIGAKSIFNAFCNQLTPDFSTKASNSRLLVELNRSLHHKQLFSAITQPLTKAEKEAILQKYYFPYRDNIENQIQKFLKEKNQVIHLSIHSFTPSLNGMERKADIGLLYDPANGLEKSFCKAWKFNLNEALPNQVVRLNYPYLGKADGLTSYFRNQFSKNYIGIELEVKNDLIDYTNWKLIQQELISSFEKTLGILKNDNLIKTH